MSSEVNEDHLRKTVENIFKKYDTNHSGRL